MKIFLASSYAFVKDYVALAEQLKAQGHSVILPEQTEEFLKGTAHNNRTETQDKEHIKTLRLQSCDKIKDADCLLIANYEKNSIPGHIGSAVFMKMSIGFFLRKPMFVLYHLPTPKELKCVDEITIFNPTIINGDLSKISL
jgi:hypothetical protein